MLEVFNLGNHAIELVDIDHGRRSKGNTRKHVQRDGCRQGFLSSGEMQGKDQIVFTQNSVHGYNLSTVLSDDFDCLLCSFRGHTLQGFRIVFSEHHEYRHLVPSLLETETVIVRDFFPWKFTGSTLSTEKLVSF